jgi:hypothetical protein
LVWVFSVHPTKLYLEAVTIAHYSL